MTSSLGFELVPQKCAFLIISKSENENSIIVLLTRLPFNFVSSEIFTCSPDAVI